MEVIKIIAEFFLVSLAFSYTLFSPIAPSSLTGNGFIKLISNISISCLVLVLILNPVSGLVFKAVPAILLILVTFYHADHKGKLMWLLYFLITILLGYYLFSFSKNNPINTLFLFSSTLLIGIITYAMTLGHWYLVVPKLSEKPLKIAAIITWIILAVKFIIAGFTIVSKSAELQEADAFLSVVLIMRITFGYIVILIMSIFNWKLVKLRSIQSSTGILYAMTFFIFIGELISTYIYFTYGLLL